MFDKQRNVFIKKTSVEGASVFAGRQPEEGANVDLGKMQPLFQRMHWAHLIAQSAANLNLAPTAFAAQKQDRDVVLYLYPTTAFKGIVLPLVQADNLGPAQTARISDQQNRPIPQAALIEGQGGDHRTDNLRQCRFFLNGWPRVLKPDTSKNSRDVPVLTRMAQY